VTAGLPADATARPCGVSGFPADVVKVGGSLAREPGLLRDVMGALAAAHPLPLVVPGGGALADGVRALYAHVGLSEQTAHRMALLALDQQALWLAELAGTAGSARRVSPAQVVRSVDEIAEAVRAGALPVLAPADWLGLEEPLPVSWEVTSDSIAAWVAGRLGARRLFLLKSFRFHRPEMAPDELGDAVDGFFLRALPEGVECRFVDGRDPASVGAMLTGDAGAGTLVRRSREPGVTR
jgi:aspartokinase-like uncharacterized kinase